MSTEPIYSPRQCAEDLHRILARCGGNLAQAEEEALPYLRRLLAHPDLFGIGVKRDGNHTPNSFWLYFDHDLQVMTAQMPRNTAVPTHNHGTWEVVGVYRGAIKYRQYERLDDGSKPYYSELRAIEDRIMYPGDVSICPPPPHDIHGFTALTDDTHIVAIVGGPYAPVRQYHNPAEGYYVEQGSQEWRLSRDRK
jgi:predicted metal-dependent enzyme (double-stranded beta helix superfamily)